MGSTLNPMAMMALKQRARQLTCDLLRLASRRFGVAIPEPSIRFDLHGMSAGQVRTSDGLTSIVRYNPALLSRHPESFLSATVPHEVAHLVVFRLFGLRVRPHGREWRSIMQLFDAEPRRCHTYDVGDLQTRHLRRYRYRCGCRSHSLTSIRHNRILDGKTYICRRCEQTLKPDLESEENDRT